MPEAAPRGTLAYAAYDAAGVLAATLALPLAPLWLWYGYGNGLAQRLGIGWSERTRTLATRPLWIHAASVGEVRAARALVEEIRRRRPQIPIVVSTTTVTGRAVAESDLAPEIATLLPIDVLGVIGRALQVCRPRCMVVTETEIWPGLFRAARRLSIPLVIASGRISPRSVERYGWAPTLIRNALGCVAAFGMQTVGDAERIIAVGAPPERVSVTGSLKASPPPVVAASDPPLRGLAGRPVLVAASTQPGEEQFVLDACLPLWSRYPHLLLLVAPRRPERFDEVDRYVRRSGVGSARRSAIGGVVAADTRIVVLDTIGELVQYFAAATAVFIGGTIAPLGGHNVLEPAAFAKPVAFGPHVDNVAETAAALRAAGGGTQVLTTDDLTAEWGRFLADPRAARAMGERASSVIEAGRVTIERTWNLIAPYLDVHEPA